MLNEWKSGPLLYIGDVALGSTSGIGVTAANLTQHIPRQDIWQYVSPEAWARFPAPADLRERCCLWSYTPQAPWLPFARVLQLLAGPFINGTEWVAQLARARSIYSVPDSPVAMQKTMAVSSMLGVPYVAHIMDNWVETATGFWRSMLTELTREYLRRARRSFVISQPMASRFQDLYGVRCDVAFNPGSLGVAPPRRRETGTRRLLYTGSAYGWTTLSELNAVGHAVARARASGNDVEFRMIISGGHEKSALNTPDGVEIVPVMNYKDVQQELSDADALLVVLGADISNPLNKYSIPTKLGDYIRTSLPILGICHEDSALGLELREHDGCWFVPAGRKDLLEHGVLEVLSANISPVRRGRLEGMRVTFGQAL